MALLVSGEEGVAAGAVVGEGFGGGWGVRCGGWGGGGFFVVGGGGGEGEEVVGDDALGLGIGGGLAVWLPALGVCCLTGFRGSGCGGWLSGDAVVGCGSPSTCFLVLLNRLCCSGSKNSFAMGMPPHLLSTCSRGVEVVLSIPRPIVILIHRRWESAERARAPSFKIGVCRLL